MISMRLKNVFTEGKEGQRAHILSMMICLLLAAYVFGFFCDLYYGDRKSLVATAAASLLLLVPFWLLRRRKLLASSLILSLETLATLTLFATLGQGCHDISLFAFPVVLVFTSMAFNRSIFYLNLALMIVSTGWLVFGQMNGWYVPQGFQQGTYWVDFLILTVILLVSAFAIDLLVKNLRKNLERAEHEIAQRKEAEQALRASEETLRLVFDSITDGLAIIDSKGMFSQCNSATLSILKLTKEQFLGRALTDPGWKSFREDGSDFPVDEQPAIVAFKTGKNKSDVFVEELPSGDRRWIRVSAASFNVKGNAADTGFMERNVLVTFSDITESKLHEKEILASQRLMQELVESPPGIIIMAIDRNYQYLCFNTAHRTAMKSAYNKNIEIGMNALDCISSQEDKCKARNNYDKAMAGETHTAIEIYGEINKTYFESHYNPIYNEKKEVIGITVYAMDITGRVKAEKELQQSKTRLADAQAVTHVGSWETDLSNFKVIWSEETYRIFELDSNSFQASHQAFLDFVHPEDRAKVDAAFLESFDRDTSNAIEHRIITSSGAVKFIEERWRILRNNQGKPATAFGTCQDVTDRVKAEIMLRENQSRLELATSSANLGIWDWDIVNNKMLWDDQMFRLYGITEKPASYGVEIWKTGLHPDDVAGAWEACQASLCDDKKYDIEFRVVWPDKTIHYIKAYGLVERDPSGAPQRMIGINYDITEQKQTENHLKMLNETVEIVPDAAYWMDVEGHFLYVNASGCTMLGYTEEELLKLGIFDINPRVTTQRWAEVCDILRTRKTFTSESVHRRKDGFEFPVEISSTYFMNEGKEYINGFARDISVRKRTEEKIRSSEEKFAKAFRASPTMVTIAQISDGRIIEVNDSFEKIMGYKHEEVIGHSVFELGLWVNIAEREHIAPLLLANGNIRNEEVHFRNKNGDILTCKYSSEVIELDGNTCALSVIENITESKRMEEELQKSQKLESLGILAGGIAHDFNNLLGGIYGYIDLAGEFADDDKLSLYLSKAITTIERARGLTLQLLTFAKGGAPVKKAGSLFPFVQETANFALSGSNVSCKFEISKNLSSCDFDKNQIGQVIDNIVINAKQAMPDGGTIVLSARNINFAENEHPPLAGGDYIMISIKDTGIGIPKNILPRIFDPFYTTKATGHGLGLSSCYSIIKRHEGCIDVESEPGQGSTFHVFLPASKDSVSSSQELTLTFHKGGGTFLVMDDVEEMQETFRDMLEMFGYTVECRNNGEDAIDFVMAENRANRKIAGMIFDLTIPGGMGGKEAIVEIRKTNPTTPVFVTSGYAEDPIMANPTGYGFTASIRKPFRKTELSEMLNNFMERPQIEE